MKADYMLDVRGKPCPIPLIMLKKKMKKICTEKTVEILVESIVVKENIERYSRENQIDFKTKEENGIFKIYIKKIKADEKDG